MQNIAELARLMKSSDLKDELKQKNKLFSCRLNSEKKKFYNTKVFSSANAGKTMWGINNSEVGNNRKHDNDPIRLKIDDVMISDLTKLIII